MTAASTVFLSYRRSDTQDVAGRLFDVLSHSFGRHRIFKDVDSIPIASDFRAYIVEQIRQSVVLVLIGPHWLAPLPGYDRSRLWHDNDFVRLEIESALAAQAPLVPVLVNGARMPPPDQLPPSIQALRGRHGIAVRPDPDFRTDVGRLGGMLTGMLEQRPERKRAPDALLDDLLATCQAWHNEIIATIGRIIAVLRDEKLPEDARRAAVENIELVYQNTRTHVPKVLSARRLLSRFDGTGDVAAAVDAFLGYIFVATNDSPAEAASFSPYCLPASNWIVPGGGPGSGGVFSGGAFGSGRARAPLSVSPFASSLESVFASEHLHMSLGAVAEALQHLSDAVAEAKLLA